MTLMDPFLFCGALVTLVVGASLDLQTRRIPNTVTFGSAVLGFAANLALKQVSGAGQSVEGWLAGVGILLLPFIARGVGGGDVKLLAAAGAWYGPGYVFHCLFWAALAGSVVGLVLLAVRGRLLVTLRGFAWRFGFVLAMLLATVIPSILAGAPTQLRRFRVADDEQSDLRLSFPFGPALALGGLFAVILG